MNKHSMGSYTESLKCQVCRELAVEAVESTCECHVICCNECAFLLDKCCICKKVPFRFEPAFTIRRQIKGIPVDCKYCQSKVRLDDIHLHEKNCEQRPRKCGFHNCNFVSDKRKDVLDHLIEKHGEEAYLNYDTISSALTTEKKLRQIEAEAESLNLIIRNFQSRVEELEIESKFRQAEYEKRVTDLNESINKLNVENADLKKQSERLVIDNLTIISRAKDAAAAIAISAARDENLWASSREVHVPVMQTNDWNFVRAAPSLEIGSDLKQLHLNSQVEGYQGAITQRIEGERLEKFSVRIIGRDLRIGIVIDEGLDDNLDGRYCLLESSSGKYIKWNTYEDNETRKLTSGSVITVELNPMQGWIRFLIGAREHTVDQLGIQDEEYRKVCFIVQAKSEGDSAEIL